MKKQVTIAAIALVITVSSILVYQWHSKVERERAADLLLNSFQVSLKDDDVVLDGDDDTGIYLDVYLKLKLTPETFRTLGKETWTLEQDTRRFPNPLPEEKWPWRLPADAKVSEWGYGRGYSFMFSREKMMVYIYMWSM